MEKLNEITALLFSAGLPMSGAKVSQDEAVKSSVNATHMLNTASCRTGGGLI